MNLLQRVSAKCRRIYYRTLGHYPTSIGGRLFKVAPNRFEFWQDVATGDWEPQTFEVLRKFLSPTSVYYDVGAWVGPTVLFAAPRCWKVFCFEPDPVAYRTLRRNIELNALRNVQSFSVALAGQLGVRRMASFGHELGDSRTSLLKGGASGDSVDVIAIPWSVFADDSRVPQPDFIKIDIEGGEFELLPHLTNYLRQRKPVLYLSTHAPFLDSMSRGVCMERVWAAVSHYDRCLNERLEEVDMRELLSDRSLDECRAFVFVSRRDESPV